MVVGSAQWRGFAITCFALNRSFPPAFQTANPHGNCTLEGKAQSEYSREKVKTRICPGETTPRPLGRYAHAAAYIESEQDDFHLLFVFGGRENADSLRPLDDLW